MYCILISSANALLLCFNEKLISKISIQIKYQINSALKLIHESQICELLQLKKLKS